MAGIAPAKHRLRAITAVFTAIGANFVRSTLRAYFVAALANVIALFAAAITAVVAITALINTVATVLAFIVLTI